MAAPTSPPLFIPEAQQLYIGPELVAAGTAATSGYLEWCKSIVTTPTHNIYESVEYQGYAYSHNDRAETTHESQTAISVSHRSLGASAIVLAGMHGTTATGAADTKTGAADPYQHVLAVGPNGNRCQTFTVWHNMSDASNIQMLGFATAESWRMAFSPGADLAVDISLRTMYPAFNTPLYSGTGELTYVAPPTTTNLKTVGLNADLITPLTRTYGFQANYQLQGSGGLYTANILGGEITLSRAVTMKYGTDPTITFGSQARRNPIDIVTGELMVAGHFDLAFDGIGAGTAMRDFLTFARLGASGSPHKIKFVDANSTSHFLQFDFWPVEFNAGVPGDGGSYVTLGVDFTAHPDANTLSAGSGVSHLKTTITNGFASLMIT